MYAYMLVQVETYHKDYDMDPDPLSPFGPRYASAQDLGLRFPGFKAQ